VVREILANLDLAIDASRHLLSLVEALQRHDMDGVGTELRAISDLEARADETHQRAVENVCSGSFFGGIREDILAMLEEIDGIADSAKGSAMIFTQRRIADDAIDYMFRVDVLAFFRACVEATELFKAAVELLGKRNGKAEAIKAASEVEKGEERADAFRAKIVENLLHKDGPHLDVLDVVMLKDALFVADNVADHAENGSDVILVLIAKGYT
jgi:predicted phosphate transport protein (TIGR00153 family)